METLTTSPTPATGPRNGYGTTALVVGIVGVLFCWVPVFGIILAGVAVLFGILGLGRVKRGEATNHGPSVAGVVLGSVAALIGITVTAIVLTAAGHATHRGSSPAQTVMPMPTGGDILPAGERKDASSPIAGDGTYTVPGQMTPGTWQSAGPADAAVPMCYWARLSGLSGDPAAVRASDLTKGQAIITLAPSDAGFSTSGCSPWTKVG